LEALDKEEWKVYLVTGRYEELAKKIKEANAERVGADAEEANSNYKKVAAANTTLGNRITSDELKELGLNKDDFNEVDV